MTPDDFDDFDKDIGGDSAPDDGNFGDGDFGAAPQQQKVSLKDAWENNPMLKLAALVLGLVLVYGVYTVFGGGEEELENRSSIKAGNIGGAKVIPGKESYDKVYSDALKENNEKVAKQAEATGQSAIPIPIATTKSEDLDIPDAKVSGNEDPLAEWRARVERKRKVEVQETIPEEPPIQPEMAPMVQPVQPVRQTPVIKTDPQAAKTLSGQMRTILAAQAPAPSKTKGVTTLDTEYIKMVRQQELAAQKTTPGAAAQLASGALSGTATGTGTQVQKADIRTIVPAGNIVYAQLLNELNSDVPGPALAQVMSGPMAGAKAIGGFSVEGEYLVIRFNRLIKDDVVYGVDGIAMNEETTLSAHQSDIEHHYFSRIILPAAAKFVEGYSSAIADRGTTTIVTDGGGAIQDRPSASPKEAFYEGLEEAGSVASDVLDRDAKRPITVRVYKGTTMGILFMTSVTTESAEKQ